MIRRLACGAAALALGLTVEGLLHILVWVDNHSLRGEQF